MPSGIPPPITLSPISTLTILDSLSSSKYMWLKSPPWLLTVLTSTALGKLAKVTIPALTYNILTTPGVVVPTPTIPPLAWSMNNAVCPKPVLVTITSASKLTP